MKKIAVITGTRAEYGILYPLLLKLKESDTWDLQIIVTGMHLSPEFGLTYKKIEEDGFVITDKVEMLLSSDTDVGITKSVGLGIIGFADSLRRLSPEIVLVLGDRYETYAASIAAFLAKIPICHFHGGELTEGMIDEGIRHSITKLSTYHFASTENYRNRIVQMGESPNRVYNVGALGLENIKNMNLMSKEDLEKAIDFRLDKKTLLFTYHPESIVDDKFDKKFDELFMLLEKLTSLNIIFTMPNSDSGGRIIIEKIKKFVNNNPHRSTSFISLGQERYLSTLKYVDLVIGNSSSGIIEVPSFKIPTVNIGNRQRGRIRAGSVIDVELDATLIEDAVLKALSNEFKNKCKTIQNPYDNDNISLNIMAILDGLSIRKDSTIKRFFDLDMENIL